MVIRLALQSLVSPCNVCCTSTRQRMRQTELKRDEEKQMRMSDFSPFDISKLDRISQTSQNLFKVKLKKFFSIWFIIHSWHSSDSWISSHSWVYSLPLLFTQIFDLDDIFLKTSPHSWFSSDSWLFSLSFIMFNALIFFDLDNFFLNASAFLFSKITSSDTVLLLVFRLTFLLAVVTFLLLL